MAALVALAPVFAIGSAIFGTVATASAARQQNRAIERSMRSRRASTDAQMKQLNEAAQLEQYKIVSRAERTRARIRVAFGEGGSARAMSQNDAYLEALDLITLKKNLAGQVAQAQAGRDVDIANLSKGIQNPLLPALEGAGVGLQIASSANRIAEDFAELQKIRQA
jgi:dethiobiotin synthetase